ncbi:MAG: AMP-binding protein [Verrucomicrobiota bacterium]
MTKVIGPIFSSLALRFKPTRQLGALSIEDTEQRLFLTQSLDLLEALSLQSVVEQPIRFIFRSKGEDKLLARTAGLDAVGIERASAEQYREWIAEAFAHGKAVCLISKGLNADFIESIAIRSHATLIPVTLSSDSDIAWSKDTLPLHWRNSWGATRLYFGEPLQTSTINQNAIQSRLLDLEARALEEHPMLKEHLATACVRGLKKRQFKTVLIDGAMDDKAWKGGMLLALAWEMKGVIEEKCSGHRVGLVLPPGIAGSVINLAVLMAGKIPVNFNYTAGKAAAQSALDQSEVQEVITARKMHQKLKEFPWPETCYDVTEWFKGLDKKRVLKKRIAVALQPLENLLGDMGIPPRGDLQEAGLLFTSGSSGEPKGVPLSHRNILANIAQIRAVLLVEDVPSVLGHLPIFHSFGFTVMLWWPLVYGPQVVTYTSPLESSKLIDLIERHEVAMLVTTPTFLRQMGKKAKPAQLASLKLVVTGAEKLPQETQEEFEKKFPVPVAEGYGMTEATPVIATNRLGDKESWVSDRKVGAVGIPLPGVSVRVVDPETQKPLPLSETGILKFRGSNLFRGYLNRPDLTEPVLQDGWYLSGDLGHLRSDGFLVIEGRLSRFSKIGGEMVPHGTVESHIRDILIEIGGEDSEAVVAGVDGGAKGEQLVALVNCPFDLDIIRKRMLAKGLPSLWIPKKIKQVEKIPLLVSGKLDLKAVKEEAASLI